MSKTGHLVSIHNTDDMNSVLCLTYRSSRRRRSFWFGLKNAAGRQRRWVSKLTDERMRGRTLVWDTQSTLIFTFVFFRDTPMVLDPAGTPDGIVVSRATLVDERTVPSRTLKVKKNCKRKARYILLNIMFKTFKRTCRISITNK